MNRGDKDTVTFIIFLVIPVSSNKNTKWYMSTCFAEFLSLRYITFSVKWTTRLRMAVGLMVVIAGSEPTSHESPEENPPKNREEVANIHSHNCQHAVILVKEWPQ